MSLFSDLAQGALQSVLQNTSQAQGLQSGIMELLNQSGGIQGLADRFQQQGLGGIIESWIGTGANEAVGADQIRSVLGNDQIGNLAAKLGLDADATSSQLANLLPVLVDRLTPDGEVPDKPDWGNALANLFKA